MNKPRGIRNNNPGNIERNNIKWMGMADDQSADPRFIIFKTVEYGIRAEVVILRNYQKIHKLNTVRKIMNRYAPPRENNTDVYVLSVCNVLGVGPDDEINVFDEAIMINLLKAIFRHENGDMPYSNEQLLEGIRLADVK